MTIKPTGMEPSYISGARAEAGAKAEKTAEANQSARDGSRVCAAKRDSLTLSGERASKAPSLSDIRRRLVESLDRDAPADKLEDLASRVADGGYRPDPAAIARAMVKA